MQNTILQIVGSIGIGYVVLNLIKWLLDKAQNKTIKDIKILVSVILSGAIIHLTSFFKDFIWYYFIGLLVGVVINQIIDFIKWQPRNREKRNFIAFMGRGQA